jgi:hypothetical protein
MIMKLLPGKMFIGPYIGDKMKTIIAGSRSITDPSFLESAITKAKEQGIEITEVVSGMAGGVDQMGEKWARDHGILVTIIPAKWKLYGLRAGPIRNAHMAQYADAAIILWDGKSKGTKNMIYCARRKGLKSYITVIIKDK